MPKAKTKLPKPNRGGQAVVARFFRGMPVVDATEPLRIVVNGVDIRHAKKLDPNNCVFAQACRRLFDSHAVLFLRRRAYVELPDSKGKRAIYRYIISSEMSDRIAQFDKTGIADEGGFILNVPTPSLTMEGQAKAHYTYQKALRSGHKPIRRGPNKKRVKAMLAVRDGRGKLGINYAF